MKRGLALCLLVLGGIAVPSRAEPARIVLIAGEESHSYGTHEFNAGASLLAEALRKSPADLEVVLHRDGWPDSKDTLRGAAALVVYMDGGASHPILGHQDEVDAFVAKGGGVMVMHYALEVPVGPASDALERWIGGFYRDGKSTNPVWTPELKLNREHPIARGVGRLSAPDEWYFNLQFAPDASGRTPLLTAIPDDHARENPTWPRTPNDEVLAQRGRRETLAWVLNRPDGGRGAGFSGGHFHWNWGNDAYRTLVLNTILWVAGIDVPSGGVTSSPVPFEALRKGQDEREPWFFFDPEEVRKRFGFP